MHSTLQAGSRLGHATASVGLPAGVVVPHLQEQSRMVECQVKYLAGLGDRFVLVCACVGETVCVWGVCVCVGDTVCAALHV